MSLRKITSFKNEINSLQSSVYRDTEYDEFRVRFYRDGTYQANADYHTDDKQDALDTARSFCSKGQ